MIPRRFFWLFDLLALGVAFFAAYRLVPYLGPVIQSSLQTELLFLDLPRNWNGQLPALFETLWIFLVMALTTLVVIGLSGSHSALLKQSLSRIVIVNILAVFSGMGMIALTMFALKSPGWSRLLIFLFGVLSGFGLVTYRLVLRKYFQIRQHAGFYHKNVLLIGTPSSIVWMRNYFAENIPANEYRILGYLKVGADLLYQSCGDTDQTESAFGELGRADQLGDLLINCPVHEVVAVHPESGGEWVKEVIMVCDYFSMPLRVVPEALLPMECRSLRTLYHAEPLHLPAVVLSPPRTADSEALFFKRVFDLIVAAILLVLLSPLLLLIAIAIKLTSPNLPIFYHWRVVGRNGVEFTGYKFTTMVSEADTLRSQLVEQNEMSGPVFKMREDPRVTSLGRFLRKYSLNELPQLWSVLKGDMSLVGPRPAFRHELQRYEFWHKRKLSIQPGITCLWQVNGRNKINDFDDWVRLDLEYIDNWSLWLDVKILFRTAKTVIAGTGW
jgi:exopolysaccharide biosynthesis polyprenyl glycosylphosphotransferase